MLILSRQIGEVLYVGEHITFKLASVGLCLTTVGIELTDRQTDSRYQMQVTRLNSVDFLNVGSPFAVTVSLNRIINSKLVSFGFSTNRDVGIVRGEIALMDPITKTPVIRNGNPVPDPNRRAERRSWK